MLARVAVENPDHVPVVLGGDLNSWQAARGGDPAHDALVAAGFYDTADAVTQVNTRWTTYNAFARTVPKSPSGWGARLDVIATKGLGRRPVRERAAAHPDEPAVRPRHGRRRPSTVLTCARARSTVCMSYFSSAVRVPT
ncbi:hypothetical protein GCM10025868_46630 [Angustibacter aerolatus]|uniref:Endonuclease/exonuclease/phosphatase domain-containing protein n=1 Tax=Angustibacter aerolatus TaxID=1162965 RepID=A0ABQ6JMC9_9ACTN|nr:hypothetical protein [Angustibacter aerolatus]GMA89413.1 hypothetical protein GCM10025868_46630 [Angustibacter aerolatus]